ncbi:ABC transporter permease [Bartonella krasnovii]|uniref:Iron chelate uptake ABC transporter family permease subunit n=1 Tax=Bartonella krasnovii TaxID=2267275 RepID=A0A5B9D2H8_9HYPH|nr:iron chelate uptake ABC transporter family permease subunit [Bartonella krasnovii]QEE12600.1 iron chelate uptake ABC transporter family permease subunit [Bartonella krasnovii]UNF28704.1 iron chelate uptake ABC transporter family permease subunit [Bartonella krasnovii]UNF35080.1 iron chelate uptake ABC transporter family permease subunit [Bartonella krasnovii]UNF36710.1 iron chelate uptake ABC transporter family permease subunit [Bartonella krasnovii]UNF38337.1 iron chelate uptake ABC transp
MKNYWITITLLIFLSILSIFVGYSDVTPSDLFAADPHAWLIFWQTRLPRTIAILLVGASLALSGMIMQLLTRNRFVEPSTAGTVESASLGILFIMIFLPDIPVLGKMIVAALFAMMGTLLFMFLLRRIPLKSALIIPLTGIMLSYIIGSLTNTIADYEMLLPSLQAYLFGSFAMILEGKYELLWLSLPLCLLAYSTADRFTVASLGEDFTNNLGLNYRVVMFFGLFVVAAITAVVVCTVGRIPFVGLIIPNIVSSFMGDNMRYTAPWVAISGAGLVLICDLLGRIIHPSLEIPISTIMGVIGSFIFMILLLRWRKRLG